MAETNAIKPELAKKYFDLDDECAKQLLDLQMQYMSDCRAVRESQKRNFKMGVAEGLPKDGFKLELKRHRLESKHAKQLANLMEDEEDDAIETADLIREALGGFRDTELGKAAVEAAETKPKARGRKKGAKVTGDAPVSEAAPGGDPLSSLIDDSVPETDMRPAFLRDKDRAAAEANAAALERGISELKH